MSQLDSVRRHTLAALDEIRSTEASLKAQGIDATEPDDRQQLRDSVARIQRKLSAAQESAE